MRVNRRDVLRAGLTGSSLVALGAATVPAFLGRTAARASVLTDRGERVLVVVQLLGGNDGLNTVVPHKDPGYDRARRVLRLNSGQLVTVSPEIGLHPGLGGFGKLLEAGRLAIVQGVGYPNPDRSHFRSMEIWETARVDNGPGALETGWLGRVIDRPVGTQATEAVPALSLGGAGLPLALKSRQRPALSVQGLEQFRLKLSEPAQARQAEAAALAGVARGDGPCDPVLDFVRRSTLVAYQSSQGLESVADVTGPKMAYPATGLGQRLANIARILKAGFPTPIFYTTLDGFDTHANQLGSQATLLAELGDALAAFEADLKDAGQADRVATLIFSEFGRRVAENASAGTDHGAAAPAFVIGPVASAGLVGAHPPLDDLDDGDLKHHTDFRRIYASLLADWLEIEAEPVLGPGFEPLPLFARRS
jgi:uncharacterized protein (DUF1501 family)